MCDNVSLAHWLLLRRNLVGASGIAKLVYKAASLIICVTFVGLLPADLRCLQRCPFETVACFVLERKCVGREGVETRK